MLGVGLGGWVEEGLFVWGWVLRRVCSNGGGFWGWFVGICYVHLEI